MHLAIVVCAIAILPACGSESDETEVRAVIGPAGGTLSLRNGASVIIPPGALAEDVEIAIRTVAAGFPALAAAPSSTIFEFTPHDLAFAEPVRFSVAAADIVGTNILAYMARNPTAPWEEIGAVERVGGRVEWTADHFSYVHLGRQLCGLYRQACCDSVGETACAGAFLRCQPENDICVPCGLNGEYCCDETTDGPACGQSSDGELVCNASGVCACPTCEDLGAGGGAGAPNPDP